MNRDKLHHARLKDVAGIRQAEANVRTRAMPDRPSRKGGHLEFVDDEVIKMMKAGRDDLGQTFGGKGTHFEICLHADGPGRLKNRHPAIRAAFPWRIHPVVQPGKTKVKYARAGIREVEMVGCQQTAGTGVVQMCSPARVPRGEGIRERRSMTVEHEKARAFQTLTLSLLRQRAPVLVVSKQANGGNRHLGIQTLDANREIACRPATANVLLENLDLVFFPWPAIHELVVVGAPGAACNETKPVFPGLHSASGLRTGSVTSRSLSMALAGAMPFDARVS